MRCELRQSVTHQLQHTPASVVGVLKSLEEPSDGVGEFIEGLFLQREIGFREALIDPKMLTPMCISLVDLPRHGKPQTGFVSPNPDATSKLRTRLLRRNVILAF